MSWLILASLVVVVVFTFRDYGITWDEEWQNDYGHRLLAYYLTGFEDRSAFDLRDLHLYGGLFDMTAAALNAVSSLDEYETRHLLGGLLGVAGMCGCWRLAVLLAGERAGLLTLGLLVLTPSLFGHMFNNPKDAPFAWGMIWITYLLCRLIGSLPRPSAGLLAAFGMAVGLTLGIRVGGLLAVVYLLTALGVHFLLRRREGLSWLDIGREGGAIALRLAPAMLLAYGLMAFFWPWSAQSPLNPLRALLYFNHVDWKGTVLFDGEIFAGADLPALYLPILVAIKMPEVVLLGLLAALASAAAGIKTGAFGRLERTTLVRYFAVVLAAAFPLLYAVIVKPLAFNGIRHFLFAVPPLIVLAGVGIDALWRRLAAAAPRAARPFALLLTLAAGVQALTMARLHPNEYVYFNSFVGGTKGAAGKFELDYWGNSLAEASRSLAAYLKKENGGKPVTATYRVAVCGYPLSALHFLPSFIKFTANVADAHFLIGVTQRDCMPGLAGRRIVEVAREGAVLSAVKDRRNALPFAENLTKSSKVVR